MFLNLMHTIITVWAYSNNWSDSTGRWATHLVYNSNHHYYCCRCTEQERQQIIE